MLALRDIIILNLGFFGLLRRGDLLTVQWSNIQWSPEHQYLLLDIPSSKTDRPYFNMLDTNQRKGRGVTIAVPLQTQDGWAWQEDLAAYWTLT